MPTKRAWSRFTHYTNMCRSYAAVGAAKACLPSTMHHSARPTLIGTWRVQVSSLLRACQIHFDDA